MSSVNRELEVLRRMFKLATEWQQVDRLLPKVEMLAGENHRERVLTDAEEDPYLKAAAPLLRDVATILVECGLRPEELFRLERPNVRDGKIVVLFGKTANARREIPYDPDSRTAAILSARLADGESRWVFPAPTKSGHIEPSSLKKQHEKAIEQSGVEAFVLYTLRHTCLTRWAEYMDPWTLGYLAGHESMETTKRYVHPQAATVQRALRRVAGRHKSGHSVVAIDSERKRKKAANE